MRRTGSILDWSDALIALEMYSAATSANHRVTPSNSGAQNVAGQRPGMRAALVQDLAIDDGVFDSFRPHHESASAAGQIVDRFPSAAGDLIVVKDRNVSG